MPSTPATSSTQLMKIPGIVELNYILKRFLLFCRSFSPMFNIHNIWNKIFGRKVKVVRRHVEVLLKC